MKLSCKFEAAIHLIKQQKIIDTAIERGYYKHKAQEVIQKAKRLI